MIQSQLGYKPITNPYENAGKPGMGMATKPKPAAVKPNVTPAAMPGPGTSLAGIGGQLGHLVKPNVDAGARPTGIMGKGAIGMGPIVPPGTPPGGFGDFFANSPRGQMGEEAFARSQAEYLKSPAARVMQTMTGTSRPTVQPRPNLTPAAHPAPAAAPASSGGVPGARTSTFGSGGDLRGTQILPGTDPRLSRTQGQVDTARNALAGGPDRFELAGQRYKDFLTESAPGDFDSIRMVGQRAGASGTIGSGMEARGFADTGRAIESARGVARNRFLGDALEGTIQDRRNQFSDLSGYEDQLNRQDTGYRDEARAERGYQSDAAQRSLDNRRQQALDEDFLTGTQFDRNERHTMNQADIGFRANPADYLLQAASGQQGVANQGGVDLAELMRQYALGRSQIPPTSGARVPQRGNLTQSGY